MRKWIVIAATLACASGGVLATARGADDQVQKTEPRKQTRTKTIVVDGGNGDAVFGLVGDDGVRIGITVADLDDEQVKTMTGALVTDVREDSPAAKAGLKVKDVIVEFDGEKVRSARQLSRLVSETPPGRSVTVAALRDGTRVDLHVTPEESSWSMMSGQSHLAAPWTFGRRVPPPSFGPGERRYFFDMPEGGHHFEFHGPAEGDGDMLTMPFPGKGRLGIGIQDLTDQLAEYFGAKDGVLVSSVTDDSPAAKAGLRAGDVITSVDDTPVTNRRELLKAVQRAADGATLKLGYVRDKKPGTASATLERREQKPKRSTLEM
jgi:membrane-associated protease RseP (regulator of RpoE activity)